MLHTEVRVLKGARRNFAGVSIVGAVVMAMAGLIPGGVAAAPAAAAVAPIPLAAGQILAAHLKAPPTTAQCEKMYDIACYQAFQLQKAYNLAPLFAKGINGRGETIVIVDAFGSPSIASDLKVFDAKMDLPNPPSFKVITPEGRITTTAKTCTSKFHSTGPDLCSDYLGWTDETSLDVEWSHAMAPGANILLVETPMTETEGIYGLPQIVAAENYVINHHLGQVISQSFGANEQTFSPGQISSLRSANFNAERHGVTMLSGSGDQGSAGQVCVPASGCANPNNVICCSSNAVISWPSSDPLTTAVGGTQLHLNAKGDRTSPDSVWADLSSTIGVSGPVYSWGASGGGHSSTFSRPSFQNGVASVTGNSRSTPDISMSAAVNGAVDYYDSSDPGAGGWNIVGGTSEAGPLFAGIVALTDQFAGHGLGDLNPALYTMAERGGNDGIVPVTSGSNAYTFCKVADLKSDQSCKSSADLVTVPGFSAAASYNLATGWGTVNAAEFVPALARAAR
jgi:subtilase family serine protease